MTEMLHVGRVAVNRWALGEQFADQLVALQSVEHPPDLLLIQLLPGGDVPTQHVLRQLDPFGSRQSDFVDQQM